MRSTIQKTILGIAVLAFLAVTFMSCRASRTHCPAYGGEAKKYIIERSY